MWVQSLLVSVTVWVTAVVLAVIIGRCRHKSNRILTPTNIMFFGTVISSFVLFLPVYAQAFAPDFYEGKIGKTILLSVHNMIRLFVVDGDFEIIQNAVSSLDAWLATAYSVFAAVLFVCAPLLTFGFLLSFFKNISSYRRYIGSFFKDVYVFSELNEKSFTLARSIYANKKVCIVFTDVFEKNEEESYELLDKTRELGAICFKKDILSIRFRLHSLSGKITFFAIGSDENENEKQAFELIEVYKTRPNTMLYLFSSSVDSELLMTSANKGEVKVRRVHDIRALVYRTLYDRGETFFANAKQVDTHEKQIAAVVVGTGLYGTEMLKALPWFCQMDGYRVRVDAFDRDPLAESKFTALCPELMSPDYNGVYVDGEAQYRLHIHSGLDVLSAEFAKKIKELTDTTYVFVSLGSDEANIRTAVTLRMLFEQIKIHPTIHAVVYNSDKKKALSGIKNYRGQAYDIEFVGDLDTLYSEAVIIDSELEQDAYRRHMNYSRDAIENAKTEEEKDRLIKEADHSFWSYEYNYRSSMASAIHLKARIACGTPGAGKAAEKLSEEEKNGLERIEHRRWNAYMRSEGYIFSGSTDRSSRNDLGKMYHDLVDFASLPEDEKRKDSRVGSK